MKTILTNVQIFDGEKIVDGKSILMADGKIDSVIDTPKSLKGYNIIDGQGQLAAPAFIDLQVNGGGGELLTEHPTLETLKIMSRAHMKFGVLHILPTLISTDMPTILSAIEATKQARNEDIGILGLHLEGPFLLDKKGGIHEKQYIHNCTLDELQTIMNASDESVRVITVAPEACSHECLEYMVSQGVKVFIGHSNASYDLACEYLNNGAIGVTHLYNAMSQLGSREPGIVGASFLTDSWAGIIADGFHVNFASIKVAKQIKHEKLYFVTDAMPPVGMGDMEFKIGEVDIHCVDNRCLSDDGTIAGSALNMNKALQNAVNHCGIPLLEALKMTSTYQAQMLGITDRLGYIRGGANADIIILNDNLDVVNIIKHGALVK